MASTAGFEGASFVCITSLTREEHIALLVDEQPLASVATPANTTRRGRHDLASRLDDRPAPARGLGLTVRDLPESGRSRGGSQAGACLPWRARTPSMSRPGRGREGRACGTSDSARRAGDGRESPIFLPVFAVPADESFAYLVPRPGTGRQRGRPPLARSVSMKSRISRRWAPPAWPTPLPKRWTRSSLPEHSSQSRLSAARIPLTTLAMSERSLAHEREFRDQGHGLRSVPGGNAFTPGRPRQSVHVPDQQPVQVIDGRLPERLAPMVLAKPNTHPRGWLDRLGILPI